MPFIVRIALSGLLLVGSMAAAPNPWTQMKMGMTAEAAATLLGPPVLQTKGRGLETWIYEHGAEVLLRGKVVGWTMPASALASDNTAMLKRLPANDYATTTRLLAPTRATESRPPLARRFVHHRQHDL